MAAVRGGQATSEKGGFLEGNASAEPGMSWNAESATKKFPACYPNDSAFLLCAEQWTLHVYYVYFQHIFKTWAHSLPFYG